MLGFGVGEGPPEVRVLLTVKNSRKGVFLWGSLYLLRSFVLFSPLGLFMIVLLDFIWETPLSILKTIILPALIPSFLSSDLLDNIR